MTIVDHPLILDVSPPELIDPDPGPTCNPESQKFTIADLFILLSSYNMPFHSDEQPGSKSDSIVTIKTRYPLDKISLSGHPKRRIFRCWPRSPSGTPIPNELHSIHRGKTTPNGLPWGATVFDFYHVLQDSLKLNIYTGSQLLEWSKANGEESLAKAEIEWASREEKPRIIDPYPPRMSLAIQEENIRARKVGWGTSMPKDKPEVMDSVDHTEDSIFKPSNSQSPWPLIPFSYPTECLQTHIPLHRLPKKITVHDPWNLLAMNSGNQYGTASMAGDANWLEKPDIVHTYNLHLSSAGEARLRKELEMPEAPSHCLNPVESISQTTEIEGGPEGLHGYFLDSLADTPPGPIVPPIFVVHDHPPSIQRDGPIDTSTTVEPQSDGAIEEAHLYLSPAHGAGVGNHSMVYKSEWEVPRTTFLPPLPTGPVLCKECVEEDVKRILAEEDGEDGETMQARWKEKSALLRKVARVVRPPTQVRFAYAEGPDCDTPERKAEDSASAPYTLYPEETAYKMEVKGPIRLIRTTIAWQYPSKPSCQHLLLRLPIPSTVKFRVVAKLSLRYDSHLQRETCNYQDFDQHMFEHWSGLNEVDPLMELCPVKALVPQFYGYYLPQLREDETEEPTYYKTTGEKSEEKVKLGRGYLSPILLLEDCGQTITYPNDGLTVEERNEVRSLVYRFHSAGWAHGSVADRNIVVQPGPLNEPPKARKEKGKRSFRLIDFGRSIHVSKDASYHHDRRASDLRALRYL